MLRLRNIMSKDVVTLTPEMSLREAMSLLATRRIAGAPVLSGDRVVGVLSASDVMGFLSDVPAVPTEEPATDTDSLWEDRGLEEWSEGDESPATYFVELWDDAGADVQERMSSVEGPEWDVLGEHTVGEAMNFTVLSLQESETVQRAADVMRQADAHRLLVMSNGHLAGIVSSSDLAGVVADTGHEG